MIILSMLCCMYTRELLIDTDINKGEVIPLAQVVSGCSDGCHCLAGHGADALEAGEVAESALAS